MTCPMLVESGVYVLGALSPAQRQAYERHLSTCAECRAEVGDLAILPGLMGRLDEASVGADEEIHAPATVLPAVIGRVRRRRRNYRFAAIAGAVAAACVALVVGLTMPTHNARPLAEPVVNPSPSASAQAVVMHQMTPLSRPSIVSASIGLQNIAGGTRVVGTCKYEGLNGTYAEPAKFVLYVVPKHGTPERIGSWSSEPGDSVPIEGMTWWSSSDIASVQLVGPDGKLQLEYKLT
jgi:Predicted transmembrane transcriptional regulator (anti-sigma factor)